MDRNDPERVRVHALLIPHHEKIGLVSLSKDYSFSLSPSLGSSEIKPAVLKIESKISEPVFSRNLAVDSLTVLYGENGCGKTHAMIDACNSLSSIKGERKLAIVWERAGQLYFDPGSILKSRVIAVHSGGEVIARRIGEPFGVAFYTTSPFEASKRRNLKSNGVVDVTPVFSPSNPFEGSALLKAFSKLPTDFPFIPRASVKLQVRVPSLRSVLDRIIPSLKQNKERAVSDTQRRALTRIDQLLESHEARAFAIQLLVISQQSMDRSLDLLIDIAGESGLLDLHAKDVSDDVKARLRSRVFQVVTEPLYERSQFISSQFNSAHMMRSFLDSELPEIARQLGRKTTLGSLSKEFSALGVTGWEHLEQASRLGLLRWSFRGLSSGQVALLLLFSSLASAISRLPEGKTTFLFIDEGEMFMHPTWQRRYIIDILSFLSQFTSLAPHIHLVLATHSLIVAADAPPNRLYDVEKGEMSNGFGYGPKDLLDNIYGVGEFHGEYASNLIAVIAEHIGSREGFTSSTAEALVLSHGIADERLKSYLVNELARRAHREAALGDSVL